MEAIFLDLWANKAVVGIQPRPAFYPLFKALPQDGNVTIFDPKEAMEGGRYGGDGGVEPSLKQGLVVLITAAWPWKKDVVFPPVLLN